MLLRPDVGTQAQFRKKKPPVTYRYDSSLSPALDWDEQNPAREQGEALIKQVLDANSIEEAKAAASKLKALSKPFLNWAGKAERLSFDVPTLPLFVHERLSTKAIIETLRGHKRDKQLDFMDLFADPHHSVADQVLRAYEHKDQWVNRMILGDSLVVMNSLLHYEGLGGQVQTIYMDPPYGVKFGSNFQPFVRKRDVKHNDDDDMTREPEMVQAYRDTWEVGLHSYLTYMRDRLLLCRELLAPSGSIFVQISDENLHHIREVMDEVFGAENLCGVVVFVKTTSQTAELLAAVNDYVLWYARDKERIKYRQLYITRDPMEAIRRTYQKVELPDGTVRNMRAEEIEHPDLLPPGAKVFSYGDMVSQSGSKGTRQPFEFEGKTFHPRAGGWKTSQDGLRCLAEAGRLGHSGPTLLFKRYLTDFPYRELNALWEDTKISGFFKTEEKRYVVQTAQRVVERCIHMTTDPGDLVLDPTCGSGTTAYAAEQWGRRWITVDVSRVPLALARQRLLTATLSWYELADETRGPAAGFVYRRKQNQKGEEIGGIVPHVMLSNIANNEPPKEEVLVDRPEEDKKITRVCGPFVVEATIPTPVDWEGDGFEDSGVPAEAHATFVERMLEVLRKSPLLRLAGNKTVALRNIRPPTKALTLSAEALVEATAPGQSPTLADAVQEAAEKNGRALPGLTARPVAFVFGPENGAVSEKLVYEAAREAHAKAYTHLYVIGFAIQPNARKLVEECEAAVGIPATYVQATPDLMMGDLLKNMRSSQIFSVCGLPEVKLTKAKDKERTTRYQVELLGLDLFDPVEMKPEHRSGNDVPAWLLDTDYNGLCFHVCQAFFPRTAAWDSLKKALKATHEESVWDHLAGTKSAPFEAGEHGQVAVKVIDDRGNELLVVKNLKEAE